MTRIRLTIPDSFIPERSYIISTLFSEFLGVTYDLTVVPGATDYRIDVGDGCHAIVRDHFFGRFKDDDGYLRTGALPATLRYCRNPWRDDEEIPVIYGDGDMIVTRDRVDCGADLFASAYFMLTRWEEYVLSDRDSHGRFPASASLAFRERFLDRPLVDDYVELLWGILTHLGCRQRRKRTEFRMFLSHDVDFPLRWTLVSAAVTLFRDVFKDLSPLGALKNLKSIALTKMGLQPDPFDTFATLMDISESAGCASTFFFMSGGKTGHDPGRYLDIPFVGSLVRSIAARGHDIGFHPSYETTGDANLWLSELADLRRATGAPIEKIRGHYLRMSIPHTWQLCNDHGMEYDCSLGYADHEGFRCGTCHEYPLFNFLSRQPLAMKEIPLIAMDASMAYYRKRSPEETLAIVKGLIDTTCRHKGVFSVLWHNSSFHTPFWEPYKETYRNIVTYGASKLRS